MPLIRYRTGDYTRILPEPCPCGSETLRLDRIERRGEGLRVSELDEILFADPAVVDGCYERRDGSLAVSVLTKGGLDAGRLRDRLAEKAAPLPVFLRAREARAEDTALYRGKRSLA